MISYRVISYNTSLMVLAKIVFNIYAIIFFTKSVTNAVVNDIIINFVSKILRT